jgi:hypothetical protein
MVDLFSVISGQQYPRVSSPSSSTKKKKSVSPNPNENVHKHDANNGEQNQAKKQKKKKKPSATLLVHKLPTPKTTAEISSNLPLSLLSRPFYPPLLSSFFCFPIVFTKAEIIPRKPVATDSLRRTRTPPDGKKTKQSRIRNPESNLFYIKNIRLLQARNRDPPKEEQQQKTRFKSYCNDNRVQRGSSGNKQREQSEKYTEGQTWRERTRSKGRSS